MEENAMSVYIGGTKVAGLEKELPAQAGNAGKYLYTDGQNASWQEASTAQIWIGTQAEYEALGTYDPEVVYEVIDDYSNITPFAKEVAERNIGELVYSTVPVTDAGLHLANGDLLDGTGIYADFYDYMVSVYNAGHTSIFTTEATWQTANTTYGKCGKYVLDTTNQTIRLPKIPGFVEGTLTESEIGNLVEAGLPNITGNATGFGSGQTHTFSGALFQSGGSSGTFGGSGGNHFNLGFDASRDSSIYGNSTTVQPEAIKLYVYIVIANTVKTPVEVDIDQVATDLNNKVSKGHEVIEFQAPTAENNYTWYRKYADGWIEQGGYIGVPDLEATTVTVTFPIVMADTNYVMFKTLASSVSNTRVYINEVSFYNRTTTSATTQSEGARFSWQVSGMAA